MVKTYRLGEAIFEREGEWYVGKLKLPGTSTQQVPIHYRFIEMLGATPLPEEECKLSESKLGQSLIELGLSKMGIKKPKQFITPKPEEECKDKRLCNGYCKCPDCHVLADKYGNVPISKPTPKPEESCHCSCHKSVFKHGCDECCEKVDEIEMPERDEIGWFLSDRASENIIWTGSMKDWMVSVTNAVNKLNKKL